MIKNSQGFLCDLSIGDLSVSECVVLDGVSPRSFLWITNKRKVLIMDMSAGNPCCISFCVLRLRGKPLKLGMDRVSWIYLFVLWVKKADSV